MVFHDKKHSSPPHGNIHLREGNSENLKHSGFGIASFSLSLICGFGIFVMLLAGFFVVTEIKSSAPGAQLDSSAPLFLISFVIFGLMLAILAGLMLGIVGLAQTKHRKLLAVIGTILNTLLLFGTIFLLIFGMTAG